MSGASTETLLRRSLKYQKSPKGRKAWRRLMDPSRKISAEELDGLHAAGAFRTGDVVRYVGDNLRFVGEKGVVTLVLGGKPGETWGFYMKSLINFRGSYYCNVMGSDCPKDWEIV